MNLKSGGRYVGMSVLPQGMAPVNDDSDDGEDVDGDIDGEDEPGAISAVEEPCLLLLTKKVGPVCMACADYHHDAMYP